MDNRDMALPQDLGDTLLPPGSAIITPNQMFSQILSIGQKVDHLSSVVDPALHVLREDVVKLTASIEVAKTKGATDLKALDVRVRALEHWRWFVLGVATFVGPVAGFVATLLFQG